MIPGILLVAFPHIFTPKTASAEEAFKLGFAANADEHQKRRDELLRLWSGLALSGNGDRQRRNDAGVSLRLSRFDRGADG